MIRDITGRAQANLFQKDDGFRSDAVQEPMSSRCGYEERKQREGTRPLCHRCSGEENQSVQFAITLIQGKWKIGILSSLQKGPARLSQLRRVFPEASKKVLTQQLREMERDGLIVRTDLSGRVRHVEYSLSEARGFAVLQLIGTLSKWSSEYASPLPIPESIQFLSQK